MKLRSSLWGITTPIYVRDSATFVKEAREAGVDGLIVVDVPAEADDELCLPAIEGGINFIRLTTPTTDNKRLPTVLKNSSGFVYYVSVTGVTGSTSADTATISKAVARIKSHTSLTCRSWLWHQNRSTSRRNR